MTIAYGVGANASGTGNTVSTGTVTSTNGSTFIIGVIIDQSGTIGTPTDSKSNTYIALTSELATASTKSRLYYCEQATGGASHSFTGNFTGNTIGATVIAIELVPAGGFKASVHGTPPTPLEDDVTPYLSSNITTTTAATMLVSLFAGNSGTNPATHAAATSFTVPAAGDVTDGTSKFTGAIAYKSLSATGTQAASWTETGGDLNCGIHIAAFEEIATSGAATAVTLSGPSGGAVGAASTNFTVGANGTITGTVTVTPADGGAGGTFTPTSVAISSGTPTATFTYTPASVGAKTISCSDNGGLTDPTPLTYTATDSVAPTLSSPVGASSAPVLCTGTVSTNEGNGTLYCVFTASATSPTAAQVKLGQDHTGAAALRVVSQAVSGTGSQSIASGSVTSGTRYAHYMHEDAATNQSTVASSASFTVAAATNATTLSVSVPDAASVTGVNGVVLSAAAPGTGVTVIKTVSAASFNGSGAMSIDITGLSVPVGQYRYVVLSKSDGTTGQSPAPFCAQGPVIAS